MYAIRSYYVESLPAQPFFQPLLPGDVDERFDAADDPPLLVPQVVVV